MRFSLVRWLQNSRWSIRAKLMGGFLIIALFLMILTVLSVLVIGELGQKINQIAHSQDEASATTQLANEVDQLRTSFLNINSDVANIVERTRYGLIGNADPEATVTAYQPYLLDYSRQRANISNLRLQINDAERFFTSSLMEIPAATHFFQMNANDMQMLLDQLDHLRDFATNKQFNQVMTSWDQTRPQLESGLTEINTLKTDLYELVRQRQKASNTVVDDATNAKNISQFFLLFAGVVAVILALGFGLMLTLVFTRPVERLRRRLVRLSEGDLATVLEVRNRDQFGELAGTFNSSMSRLGGVVEQVQHQAMKVSSAAAQIATASSHSALVSVEQAGAVAEATVTIEQLSHTAQQIAEAAALVAGAAEQALSSASDGQETVRESIVGINNLKNRVRNITDRILALSERSQRVGHIIEQVASIADQTHLLALNAAIESAAAGESGKRFAVVAASVKQLAERSRQATKDVQAVLSEIQAATNASVMATEQGMKEAERGVTLAHRTGDANESIIQMVERTVQLASAISLATQQQRSASEQVVSSMRQLATVIQDGASTAKQSSSLAASLDEVALELRQVSSQFKVTATVAHFDADGSGSGLNFEEVPHPVLPGLPVGTLWTDPLG